MVIHMIVHQTQEIWSTFNVTDTNIQVATYSVCLSKLTLLGPYFHTNKMFHAL